MKSWNGLLGRRCTILNLKIKLQYVLFQFRHFCLIVIRDNNLIWAKKKKSPVSNLILKIGLYIVCQFEKISFSCDLI